jgi:peptidyl-prolyl cis-trans isomerase D
VALLAFVVGDALSSSNSSMFSSRNKIGEIAGEEINYTDFREKLIQNEEVAKSVNNLTSLTEEQQTMIRENTWQQLIAEIVMGGEYEKLGIDVTGDELFDMLLGDNMNPMVRQLFADPATGNVDIDQARTVIRQLIEAPDNTPQKIYWLNMEEQIKNSRLQEKYNTLLSKGFFITDEQAKENALNSSAGSDISYFVKSYASISDSTIQVSDSEIKEYYNARKNSYRQPESRRIEYVNFTIEPSSEDYTETQNWIKELATEFAATATPAEFTDLSSDVKFDPSYLGKSEISNTELAAFLFSSEKGVFGPYLEGNSFRISRLSNTKMLPDSVRARHILIAPENNDLLRAKSVADSLADLLRKGADFESMARQYSTDQGSSINGGDLGWFKPGTMVQPFSDTAFFAKPREIKVAVTQYGAHIIQVTEQSKPVEKVQIATVQKEIVPSQKTLNKIYNDARTFADGVNTQADFDRKLEERGLAKRLASVNSGDPGITGMESSRELVRQSYLATTPGSVIKNSEGNSIFETGNFYTVAVLTAINKAGFTPVDGVAAGIKQELIRKKKAGILRKELTEALKGSESLLSAAQKAGVEVKEATGITFNSFQIPGAGVEPGVIAAATVLPEAKLSDPIEGNQGVYVIMVNSRTAGEAAPETIASTKAGMQQANLYQVSYQASGALTENAKIQDLRYKFY